MPQARALTSTCLVPSTICQQEWGEETGGRAIVGMVWCARLAQPDCCTKERTKARAARHKLPEESIAHRVKVLRRCSVGGEQCGVAAGSKAGRHGGSEPVAPEGLRHRASTQRYGLLRCCSRPEASCCGLIGVVQVLCSPCLISGHAASGRRPKHCSTPRPTFPWAHETQGGHSLRSITPEREVVGSSEAWAMPRHRARARMARARAMARSVASRRSLFSYGEGGANTSTSVQASTHGKQLH